MGAEGFIAAALMLLIGIVWLVWPLVFGQSSVAREDVTRRKEREALLTTYERTLATIRDLDEDHLTGKLSEADYQSDRGYWKEQGVAVLQALEASSGVQPAKRRSALSSAKPAAPSERDPDALLDDAIEQAIDNYLKSTR